MRGTFQFSGSGSFQTSGGSGILGAVIAAVAAGILVLEWVAAHLWWILGATFGIVAVIVAPLWWMAWKYRPHHGGHTWTAVAASPGRSVSGSGQQPAVGARPAAAIEGPHEVHYHFEVDPAALAEVLSRSGVNIGPPVTRDLTPGLDTDTG